MTLLVSAILGPALVGLMLFFVKRTIDRFDARNSEDHAKVQRRLDDMNGLLMTTATSTLRTEEKVEILNGRVTRIEDRVKGGVDTSGVDRGGVSHA